MLRFMLNLLTSLVGSHVAKTTLMSLAGKPLGRLGIRALRFIEETTFPAVPAALMPAYKNVLRFLASHAPQAVFSAATQKAILQWLQKVEDVMPGSADKAVSSLLGVIGDEHGDLLRLGLLSTEASDGSPGRQEQLQKAMKHLISAVLGDLDVGTLEAATAERLLVERGLLRLGNQPCASEET